ncbi:MAG TPA: hypothetical protein VFA59_04050 [Vicinamibacterales bacterium]|nr:hypothetical protein [Vicinamibacterales bacterium]
MKNIRFGSGVVLALLMSTGVAHAQEKAYFVTYDHYLEEPGNLEIGIASTTGAPRSDNSVYSAPWLEIEYGVRGWWTTEFYAEREGFRVENRFRAFKVEHRVNPVLYVEYENTTEASRIQKEIVGSGALSFEPIADLRRTRAHELEGKLILSSAAGAWNVSENIIFEKNLTEAEGIEYGYAVGVSRSLGSLASGTSCHFCRENFVVGVEAYGGLGSSMERTLTDTRHFIAPVLGWHIGERSTFKLSTGFGLTDASDRFLLRLGWSYELPVKKARP